MKTETRDKINNIVCWSILAGAAIYFSVQIIMGIASKWYILFA